MKIRELKVLRGANVWASCPVFELDLDLGEFADRLRLNEFCASVLQGDVPEGDLKLSFAFTLGAGVRKLQEIAGMPIAFSSARRTPNLVLAAVQCDDEAVGRAAIDIAWRLLTSGPVQPEDDDIQRLKDLIYAQTLSPSVMTTLEGAKKLGVPVARLHAEYSIYLVLGQGSKQKRVRWTEPDSVSGVARLAATDKYLTNQLLASIGVPVAKGRLIRKVEEAWPAAKEMGLPVVVKPYDRDLQVGVSLDLKTKEKIEGAFEEAIQHSSWVLVEPFAPGVEHRVIVVGDRVVAVTRIDPPRVIGDGVRTVAQLVAQVNEEPRRNGVDPPLSPLKIDEVAVAVITAQGHSLASVPANNEVVLVRRDPPYFSQGGTLTDLTDEIHPETSAHAAAAARMMGIPVAGLDIVAVDIAKPLGQQQGIVVEINASPGLWLHLAPWADKPRPVGQEMVAWMFPAGSNDGRIPVVALGDPQLRKPLTDRLTQAGLRVGFASRHEMSAEGRPWPVPPGPPQDRAYVLFRNPAIDIAIFEITDDELLQHGFANDRCDAVVLTSPLPRTSDRDSHEALANALSSKGCFVVTGLWSMPVAPSRVILVSEESELRDTHLEAGGRVAYIQGPNVVLRRRDQAAIAIGNVPPSTSPLATRHAIISMVVANSF